jgi:hypothetical protein
MQVNNLHEATDVTTQRFADGLATSSYPQRKAG